MAIKRVIHYSLYLTQAQAERLLALLELHPRKADASLRAKLSESLAKARAGDATHAAWLAEHGR